jgi:hypothetical protein
MKGLAGLLITVSGVTPALAVPPPAGPFLCIVEQATGFAFDAKARTWRPTIFGAGDKFIVKRIKNNSYEPSPGITRALQGAWAIWEFGVDLAPHSVCAQDFNELGYLFCTGPLNSFNFNVSNHRFITTFSAGYIQGAFNEPPVVNPEGSDTPYVSIGTCSAL